MSNESNKVEKLLWTPKEAAESVSLCERTLWGETQPRGPIPCVRIGRSVRYLPEDIKRWIESSKNKAA